MINPNHISPWWYTTMDYIDVYKIKPYDEIFLRTKARDSMAACTMWWFLTGKSFYQVTSEAHGSIGYALESKA